MLKVVIPVALLVGTVTVAAQTGPHHNRDSARIDAAAAANEAKVTKRLAGLTPGEPQACITPSRSQGASRFGDVQLIRDQQGITYLTRFEGGCSADSGDALVSRRPTERLCRGDIVQVRDMVAGISRGACVYGDFVPYRRAR